jgi:aminobenzoyl-glutamate utilization protein B
VANPESGGSDDIGNVSWVAPTAPLFYPANIPNLPGHNWANAIAMATPIAHKGVLAGSKVVALSVVDFLLRPDLVQAARTYFTDVQMKTDKPQEFLTDADVPQIQINTETMARYRPEMRKFYYDAEKYDTYLDQLGVKFPAYKKQ